MILNLVWFRRDLRLVDNQMVSMSNDSGHPCLPFFIVDPFFYTQWSEISYSRTTFLFESLLSLHNDLQTKKSHLTLFEGNSKDVIKSLLTGLISIGHTPKLYYNADVQINYGIARDKEIFKLCQSLGVETIVGKNSFLEIKPLSMDSWRKSYYAYNSEALWVEPTQIRTINLHTKVPRISFYELKTKYQRFWLPEKRLFSAGQRQAESTLKSFLTSRISGYHWKLSRPWLSLQGSTTHLSPNIAFGNISTRFIYQKVVEHYKINNKSLNITARAFLERLRWRDSFVNKLYLKPEHVLETRFKEFEPLHDDIDLTSDKRLLYETWKNGLTGFPLVDASMRQLKTIGWLNFRMRAMVATFLCINCGISWKLGALHFMNYLIDGDVAIDHWQWQMQAGITNPLSKSFRIYDPTKNLLDRDPDLQFVRYWLPELKAASKDEILSHSSGESKISGYTMQILDFKATKQTNGKLISDLRKQVRNRISLKLNSSFESSI
ncbi:MAG: FAD-binding domain-containing protein [Patescibacteria group bacterium]